MVSTLIRQDADAWAEPLTCKKLKGRPPSRVKSEELLKLARVMSLFREIFAKGEASNREYMLMKEELKPDTSFRLDPNHKPVRFSERYVRPYYSKWREGGYWTKMTNHELKNSKISDSKRKLDYKTVLRKDERSLKYFKKLFEPKLLPRHQEAALRALQSTLPRLKTSHIRPLIAKFIQATYRLVPEDDRPFAKPTQLRGTGSKNLINAIRRARGHTRRLQSSKGPSLHTILKVNRSTVCRMASEIDCEFKLLVKALMPSLRKGGKLEANNSTMEESSFERQRAFLNLQMSGSARSKKTLNPDDDDW